MQGSVVPVCVGTPTPERCFCSSGFLGILLEERHSLEEGAQIVETDILLLQKAVDPRRRFA